MSPGGENEYKRPSVTREHYDAAIETKLRQKTSEVTEHGKKICKLNLTS